MLVKKNSPQSILMPSPLLSILTTTRSEPRLIKTLESVSKLSHYIECEHIIQEAGQTRANSLHHINNSKICTYNASSDNGIYYGMNKTIARASGLYCMVLNSDDELIDLSLSRFADILKSSEIDIYLFDILFYQSERLRLFTSTVSARIGQVHPAFGMGFPHGGLVVRTEILKQHLFVPHYGLEADFAQMLSLLSNKRYTRQIIKLPIQLFNTSGASSNRGYFTKRNPHLSHLRIIFFADLPCVIKVCSLSLRLFILIFALPRQLILLGFNYLINLFYIP